MTAKPAIDHSAAFHLPVTRKYSPEIAGVSFVPAATPTPRPATTCRTASIAANTPATRTRLICPKSSVLRTGSNHSAIAVHSRARRSSYRTSPASAFSAVRTSHHRQTSDNTCQTTRAAVHGNADSGRNTAAANGG
ncbi:hypothetical protein GCM10017774_19910 [Lentzea cavernae]|uniref:Uncharacterized protein n=1 Tax=Lentzea cavernae TaxID=2020703 RepID=A0ABQ3M9I3_9PSEU|nr:hypothetical protein GCM10017774_19910 [Lentzea cavernae]